MQTERDQLLLTVRNLARFHREHEKFYSESPFHDVIRLQRNSRALKALAERWSVVAPSGETSLSPFAGASDLNDDRATETLGILFMEGGGEPAEITNLKRDLSALGEANRAIGQWLASAMSAAWDMLEALLSYPELADLLAERHRIVSNDWQCASTAELIARNLDRAVAILGRVDFTPAALRADLTAHRVVPRYLFSASEMLDYAADLAAHSAVLTHENERRWRIFHERVDQMVGAADTPGGNEIRPEGR
ncbi:hypothetical protein [Rhodococcus opacus]|uniref:Uncharacterized protein n=1 Tax=Rhodococcus opacus TaxID=37919 RepID=A0AAX3YQT7_RHOOP|nr:hypothetical protein [Rhodococcus opacus]MCZ4584292.1 hypothetical protein [Rhodococcus opacus]UZG52304.1 hypothetical protein ONE62_19015 [Rhodococcus opacus]WLF50820.1 hypothetical protein Q5707_18375 [Rhodococcus opacus]